MFALKAKNPRLESYVCTFLAVLVWSPIPLLLKRLTEGYSALQINFYVYFFAALGAAVFLSLGNRWKLAYSLSGQKIFWLVFTAFIGMVAYEILFTQSFVFLSASTANTINYFWPILMVVFSSLLLKEEFNARKAFALALGFLGVALILGTNGLELNPLGALIAFAGATLWAGFNALQKKFGFSGHSFVMLMVIIAFAFYCLFAIPTNSLAPAASTADLIIFLFLGMFSTTLGTTLYLHALRMGDTAEIASISFATPFLSLLWASRVFGEPLHWQYFAALSLFFIGMVMQNHKTSDND